MQHILETAICSCSNGVMCGQLKFTCNVTSDHDHELVEGSCLIFHCFKKGKSREELTVMKDMQMEWNFHK